MEMANRAQNVQFHNTHAMYALSNEILQQRFKAVECEDQQQHQRIVVPRPDTWKNSRLVPVSTGTIQQDRINLVKKPGYLWTNPATTLTNSPAVVPQRYYHQGMTTVDHSNTTVGGAFPTEMRYRESMDYAHLGCRHFVPCKDPGMPMTRRVGGSTMATAVCKNPPQKQIKLEPGRSIVGHIEDFPVPTTSKRVVIKEQDVKHIHNAEHPSSVKMVRSDLDSDVQEPCNLDILAQAAILVSGLEQNKKKSKSKAGKVSDDWKESVAPARGSQRVRKRQFDEEFEYDYDDAPESAKKLKKIKVVSRKAAPKKSKKASRDLSSPEEIHDEEDKPVGQTVYEPVNNRIDQQISRIKEEQIEEQVCKGALIRSKRGRSQNLPARFQGSVLGKWKKGGKKAM